MNEIQFISNEKGSFALEQNGERIAEMTVEVTDSNISVYHTEVVERLEGQGFGSKLIDKIVDYARQNELHIIPYCPFVKDKFQSNPEQYEDIWQKEES